jgi:hypothetical protein
VTPRLVIWALVVVGAATLAAALTTGFLNSAALFPSVSGSW